MIIFLASFILEHDTLTGSRVNLIEISSSIVHLRKEANKLDICCHVPSDKPPSITL